MTHFDQSVVKTGFDFISVFYLYILLITVNSVHLLNDCDFFAWTKMYLYNILFENQI